MPSLTLSAENYVLLLRDAVGLDADLASLQHDFDALPGWDSLHLLKLVAALERETGRRLRVSRVLEARTLDEVRKMAVEG